MDYDMASGMIGVSAVAPAIYTSDQTSGAFDSALYPYKALSLAIYVGVGGITFDTTNRVDFKLTHSDDDSTYTAMTDDDVILPYPTLVGTGGIVKSLIAVHGAADILFVGIRSKKRYYKVFGDFAGTHGTGTPIGINWILGHPMSAPVGGATIPDMV